MCVMKLRRGRVRTVLLKVFARCLNIACKDIGPVLVQMRSRERLGHFARREFESDYPYLIAAARV
jgi:hypothetical protein